MRKQAFFIMWRTRQAIREGIESQYAILDVNIRFYVTEYNWFQSGDNHSEQAKGQRNKNLL